MATPAQPKASSKPRRQSTIARAARGNPKAYKPKPARDPAEVERELGLLREQQAAAQFFTASDGARLNMAEIARKKHAGQLDAYGPDEQLRIRNHLAAYKRLQGQASHLKRAANKVVGKEGQAVGHVLDAYREPLLEWFARHYDTREVHRRVVEELELEHISYEVLRKWQLKNQDAIRASQVAARQDVTDLALVHKRVRLEELHDHYLATKQLFEQTHRESHRDACLRILEQIRKETDSDLLGGTTATGAPDAESMATLTTEQRMQAVLIAQLPLQALVLGKVAAARGIDPTYLLARLQQSYYARFNGFISGQQSANAPSDDFVFPSERGYDFVQIEADHRAKQATGEGRPTPLSALPEPTAQEKQLTAEAKAAMLRRLGL